MFEAFEDFLTELEMNKGAADSTIQARRIDLRSFCEWAEGEGVESADGISRRDVSDYIDHLVDEGFAYNTIVKSKYAALSAALNHASRERFISDNPMNRIETKAIKKKARRAKSESEKKDEMGSKDYLTKKEVYELAENHVPDPTDRNELLVKLMFWTGVRISELIRIEIDDDGTLDGPNSDIDPSEPSITVYAPKNDKPRTVSYPRSEINPLLRDWVSHGRLRYKYADKSSKLFLGLKKPITESGVRYVIEEAAKDMGIQEVKRESVDGREYHRVTAHLLRHSHAMYYHNEEGVPLDDLKDHLGHYSVSTTEEHYAEGTKEKMIDTFGG